MSFLEIFSTILIILALILLAVLCIAGIWDAIHGEYEDWYSFDELEGKVVELKTMYPLDCEFTGWTCLVHIIDTEGKSHVYKTSTLLYKNLRTDERYKFFIRDNAVWKVMEQETRIFYKAK